MTKWDRFWSKVDVRGPHDCWPWKACTSAAGYGLLSVMRKPMKAHRVALAFADGPARGHALHHCDQRSCCNPLHLYWGTDAENCSDRERRGRGNHPFGPRNGSMLYPLSRPRGPDHGAAIRLNAPRGEHHHGAKLTETIVRELRASTDTNANLARRFGVTPAAIRLCRTGKTWSHL